MAFRNVCLRLNWLIRGKCWISIYEAFTIRKFGSFWTKSGSINEVNIAKNSIRILWSNLHVKGFYDQAFFRQWIFQILSLRDQKVRFFYDIVTDAEINPDSKRYKKEKITLHNMYLILEIWTQEMCLNIS